MNTSDLLEQLLRGQAAQQTGAASPQGGIGGDLGGLLGGLLGGGRAGSSMGSGGLGGLGGLLGGLLGGGSALGSATQNRSGRSGGMNYAALASLGMMAFQAYQAWQRNQMISTELGRHNDDPQLRQWLDNEFARPLDAADVAGSATDSGMAAEMYLASVLLVDDQQAAERVYLDELAAALGIDPQLQVHLEQQAKGSA